MKELCIINANCIGSLLKTLLNHSPEFRNRYEVIFVPTFVHPIEGAPQVPIEHVRRCSLFLNQVGHGYKTDVMHEGKSIFEHLPSNCRTLTFPIVAAQPLWPLYCFDPRNKPEESFPFGRHPYGDSLALRLLKQGLSPDEALKRYCETDLTDVIDLGRLTEAAFEKARDLDRHADVPIQSWIEQNFVTRRLFWTLNHPTADLQLYLADALLAALEYEPVPPKDAEAFKDAQPLSEIHQPIHPQVIDHFGLQWIDKSAKYRYYGDEWLTFDEYMERYVLYQ